MILDVVAGISLIVGIALDPSFMPEIELHRGSEVSSTAREVALAPLVRASSDCIAWNVSVDSQARETLRAVEMSDLIADALAACDAPVRAMIEAHDAMYGSGSGEAFFTGPYLDVLPAVVGRTNAVAD